MGYVSREFFFPKLTAVLSSIFLLDFSLDRKTCLIYNIEKINVVFISVPMLMNNLKKNNSKCSD
jgi:hypothetical protein